MKSTKVLLPTLVLGLFAVVGVQSAEASSIKIKTGALEIVVNDGGAGDDDPQAGVISFNIASFGNFTDVEIDTQTKPEIASPFAAGDDMYLQVSAKSSAGGTLEVFHSETGFGPTGSDAQASAFGSTTGTISLDNYQGVGLFDTSSLIPGLSGSGGGFINDVSGISSLPNGGAGPYSLTQGVTLVHAVGANQQSSFLARLDISGKREVPDGGSTAALLGSALMAFGMLRRRFGRR